MSKFYLFKPNLKFIPELSVVKADGKIHQLSVKECQLLQSLKNPVMAEELKGCSKDFKKNCFYEADIADPESLIRLNYQLTPSSQREARYLRILAKSSIKLIFGSKRISLKKGTYLIPGIFPDKIEGTHQKNWLKEIEINDLRDQWIIQKLNRFKPASVLEIGPGRDMRLALKIQASFEKIDYLGIDKTYSSSAPLVIKGNALKNKQILRSPDIVIMEEVMEHMPKVEMSIFVESLFKNGARRLILTTPNKDFNVFIGLKSRHQDHHFEFSKKDLSNWTNFLLKKYKLKASVVTIGRKIQGIAPSWGIIIQKA